MTTIEFLNSVKPDSSFLSETALSFYDQSLYVAEAGQVAFNECFQAIGIDELRAMLEANELSVAGQFDQIKPEEKKSILSKVKDFFAKIWGAIKALFNKIIAAVKTFFSTATANGKKEVLSKAVNYFAKEYSKKEISFGKIYKYELGEFGAISKDLNSAVIDTCEYIIDDIKKSDRDKGATLKETLNVSSAKNIFKDMLGKKYKISEGDESVRETFRKSIISNDKLVEITSDNLKGKENQIIASIQAYAFSEKQWLNIIKNQYNDTKKVVDKLMNEAKNVVNATPYIVKEYCAICNAILTQCLTPCNNGINDSIKIVAGSYKKVAKSIISKYFQLSGKTVKESVEALDEDNMPKDAAEAEKSAEGDKVDDKDADKFVDDTDATVDEAFAWLEA